MTTIRPATPADRDALLALLPELAAFPLPAWRTAAQIAGADTRILLDALDRPDPGTLILVGDVGGTITGFIFTTTRAELAPPNEPHTDMDFARDAAMIRKMRCEAERRTGPHVSDR